MVLASDRFGGGGLEGSAVIEHNATTTVAGTTGSTSTEIVTNLATVFTDGVVNSITSGVINLEAGLYEIESAWIASGIDLEMQLRQGTDETGTLLLRTGQSRSSTDYSLSGLIRLTSASNIVFIAIKGTSAASRSVFPTSISFKKLESL